jgi:enoyl-CoA hydratase
VKGGPVVSSEPIQVTSNADGWQTWTMQLRPVNAISPEFLDALESALAAVELDDSVSVVVLGSGLRVFSAGADADWMARTVDAVGPQGLLAEFIVTMDRFRAVCAAMRRSPVLFVAALGGHTLAGGLELAAACDLRFAADEDRLQIGVPEMDLFGAMPSGGGGVQYLARLMGPSRALTFVLEAKPVNPREAQALGLVDRLVPAAELSEAVQTFAAQVAHKAGRVGVAAAKRAIFTGWERPLEEALELDQEVHWDAMRRGNFLAGVDAFVSRYGASASA